MVASYVLASTYLVVVLHTYQDGKPLKYQCWAGFKKEVKTSQGFKWILTLNTSRFHKVIPFKTFLEGFTRLKPPI